MFNKLKNLTEEGIQTLKDTKEMKSEEIISKTMEFLKENGTQINKSIEEVLGIDIKEALNNAETNDVFKVIHVLLPFPLNLISEDKFLDLCNSQKDTITSILSNEK